MASKCPVAPKLDLDITALPGGRSLAVQWTLVYDGGPDVEVFTFEVSTK